MKRNKALSEMSLEELWRLFPIFLTEHNEDWNDWYEEERKRLTGIFSAAGFECNKASMGQNGSELKIHHIGSTAIKGIWAKPIVDILVEVRKKPGDDIGFSGGEFSVSLEYVKDVLMQNGYLCMSEQADRMSFCLGYTEEGFAERVFHLHLRWDGDNDELYFRDYMNDNPKPAKQYEELKLRLWKQYEHDRDGYTNAKGEFVSRYTDMAKREYGNRNL
ncbi:MAG: GrpB family protein [Lachnospiraceae bacterium]|nr:GrpB family protein [Lachnospiraceae bacterium]